MLLHTLLRDFDAALSLEGVANPEIITIQEDSRRVTAGALFIARSGTHTNGSLYATDAINRGAVAILAESRIADCPLPQVIMPDLVAAVSPIAHLFHGRPTCILKTLGITGTNGKTTTAYLIRHLLHKAQRRCGLIGTVEIDDGKTTREAEMTTPGAVELAELLADMRDNGAACCAMEVSSHALDQHRADGIHFASAGFTNLTGDHLDYHKTMDHYAGAKARLFDLLSADAVAVVNGDDEWSPRMVRGCKARVVRFGFDASAEYQARKIVADAQGTNFVLATPAGQVDVRMRLIGRHNIQNALLAAALVGEGLGIELAQIADGLQDAIGAPGRLQAVQVGQPFAVLVDYAHTDDALQNVLHALRQVTRGKLRVMFGCGGDRDRSKRPRMADVAERLADAVYVTSDNPRTEDPAAILAEIRSGFTARGRGAAYFEVDRRAAIARVLADAGPDDVVLLAGKGHENYQIIGTQKQHFDDVQEARKALHAATARS